MSLADTLGRARMQVTLPLGPSRTVLAVEQWLNHLDETERRPSPDRAERARAEARAALASGRDGLALLPDSTVALCLAWPPFIDGLATGGYRRLLDEARHRGKPRLVRGMWRAYLDGFDPRSEHTTRLAAALDAHKAQLRRDQQMIAEAYALLDPSSAPTRLAGPMLDLAVSPETLPERIGIRRLQISPLYAHALAAAARAAGDGGQGRDAFERLFALARFSKPTDPQLGSVTLPATIKRTLPPALLLPFESADPPEGAKKAILAFMVDEFGDPRLPGMRWPDMNGDERERSERVVKRWLAIESLDVFIRIIEQTADPKFLERRDFWMPYFKGGSVTDVCLVLGTRAAGLANSMKRRGRDLAHLRWSKLSGASSDQSVLLMRMGDLTIAEWSHSGALRFFARENQHKPELHKLDYTATGLRNSSSSFQNSRTGTAADSIYHTNGWQALAAHVIHHFTGIRRLVASPR